MKQILTLIVFAISGISLAAIDPNWQKVDANKDGTIDWLAKTNLVEVTFNQYGDIVTWNHRTVKGREGATISILSTPSAKLEIAGKKPDPIKPNVQTKVELDEKGNKFLTFSTEYSLVGSKVQKNYRIHPHNLTIDMSLSISQSGNLDLFKLSFFGLANGDATAKLSTINSNSLINLGKVEQTRYFSMQCCSSFVGAPGQTLVVLPAQSGESFASDISKTTINNKTVTKGTIDVKEGQQLNLKIYGGPNELVRLHHEGLDRLPGLFEPNILGRLSLLLISFLETLRNLFGSWGLAIIALTVLIRLILWPLLQAQLRSTAEMQALAPKIQEINQKYKDDPQKKAQVTMELYRERGVNPVAGCLPSIIQLPLLLVMWRVIANFEFDQGFLWFKDLSLPDPIYILPVIYLIVTVLQTYMSTMGNKTMFRQQLIIQVIFIYIILSFPAGVTLYWILSTLIGIGQQYFINRRVKARIAQSNLSSR